MAKDSQNPTLLPQNPPPGTSASRLQDYLALINTAASVAGSIGGAARTSRERQQAVSDDAYQRQKDQYANEQAARDAQLKYLSNQLSDQTTRATTLLSGMPLGAEQQYIQSQAVRANFGQQAANMPSPSYGGTFNPLQGMNLSSFGEAATSQALAERRKALAGLEPNFQFGALSNYGLRDGAAQADLQVADYAKQMGEQRIARENAMTQLLAQGTARAQGPSPTEVKEAVAPPKQKTSIWKKIAKAALVAAPIVAAPFTGGTSLALIGGLSGAASGALSGGGWRGALTGGAMGAIPMGGGGSTLIKGAKESVGAAVKRAVLNPQALTSIAAPLVGGTGGDLLNMASTFVPSNAKIGNVPWGPRAYKPPTVDLPVGLPASAFPTIPLNRSNLIDAPPSGRAFQNLFPVAGQAPQANIPTSLFPAALGSAPWPGTPQQSRLPMNLDPRLRALVETPPPPTPARTGQGMVVQNAIGRRRAQEAALVLNRQEVERQARLMARRNRAADWLTSLHTLGAD